MSEENNAPDHSDANDTITSDKQLIEQIVETKEVPSKWDLKLRKENEILRKKLEAQQEAEKQKVAAKEAEFKATAEQIEAKYREKAAFAELKAAAVKANVIDPDVLNLMDRSAAKYNDDGELTNASELIDAFRAAKPHLFTSATSVATPAPAPRVVENSAPDWKSMTPEQKRLHEIAIGLHPKR